MARGQCAYVRTAEPSDFPWVATGVDTGLAATGRSTTWSGRSSQGQVSLVSLMTQGGHAAVACMGQSSPRTTTKGRAIAQNGIRPQYRGQGLGGLVRGPYPCAAKAAGRSM